MYENIRDTEGHVIIDHLYIFLLSILDLLDYYILKGYMDKEKDNELQKNSKINKNSNHKTINNSNSATNILGDKNHSVIDKNLIDKINSEISSRLILKKKFGGYDENNNFIITFDQAKKIHKDFLILSTNWYKSIINNKNKNNTKENLTIEPLTFKPKINPKSAKIGDEYRRKIIRPTVTI